MRKIGYMILIIFIFFIQACSARQWYDTVQQNQKLQCQKVQPSEYSDCMERANETYDQYKQKRDEVVK